ncbi:MAG TPA: NADH:flavin oxidoreductase [Methanospirillum sp.]|uniref:NADH:flavin oxidoreductase n=1 Tax=Methanospirillum sp. TaxID=45200 RepID=UPI002BF13E3A|nr:NADH:flavin oxidoreductase [Methanospirillum sp.]HWQ64975.1 NADH:flavin oxidoreductase [Methanospirillum sp.]
MRTLFDTTKIGSLTLKTRFIRSATWEAMADQSGHPTERLIKVYDELARGGVGLIITGATTIVPDPTGLPGMMSIADDSFIPDYQGLTSIVHQYDVPVIMQITFVGRGGDWQTPGGSTLHELYSISRAYGEAAIRAKKSGFDGIQIHAGHGYFLSQFLSSKKNTRTDMYGGSVANRGRFILEIYDEVRSRVGMDFGIFIKINCGDFEDEDDGVFEACQYTCTQLSARGIDGIEITGGAGKGLPLPPRGKYSESVFRDYAAMIAKAIETPVIMVGMNRNPVVMSEILNTTNIAYFSMSRPFIREPDLVQTWKEHPDTEAACTSCDACRKQDAIVCPFR